MSLDASVSRIAGRFGATFTLRHVVVGAGPNAWTAGAETVSYSTLVGREIHADGKRISDVHAEQEALITIDAKTATVEPKVGDRIALGIFAGDAGAAWRQITNVYPVREAGRISVYKLTVRA